MAIPLFSSILYSHIMGVYLRRVKLLNELFKLVKIYPGFFFTYKQPLGKLGVIFDSAKLTTL